jgi:hypothetical protein
MANAVERSCSMLIHYDKPSSANEIKEALEGNDTNAKVIAMKNAVMMLLNGEQLPHQLFITIVRYVLPSEDHTVQKLLLLYLVRSGLGGTSECTHWSSCALLPFRKQSRKLIQRGSSCRRWCVAAPPIPSHLHRNANLLSPSSDPDLSEPAQQLAAPERIHSGSHTQVPLPHQRG